MSYVAEEKKNMDQELTGLFCSVGRIQFLILFYILGGFLILGRFFISVWAGEGYEDAYAAALLLICPVLIPLIQNLGIEIQRAKNKHKFRSVLYIFIAAGNLLISIPLAAVFGTVGAAMGTCASLLIGNGLIMNLYNHRKIGLDMVRFWKEVIRLLIPGAAAVAAGAVLGWYIGIQSITEFLLAGVCYTAIYALLQWRFGLNEKEKGLVLGPVGKAAEKWRILRAKALREQ